MKETWKIPILDNRVVCIVDNNNPVLAAQISSLFSRDGYYFPLYMFPEVNTMNDGDVHEEEDDFLSDMIGAEAAVFINNSIAKMGAETFIFAGLSEFQKSYMVKYIPKFIEVSSSEEIEIKMANIVDLNMDVFECNKKDLLKGLYIACNSGKRLIINEDVDPIEFTQQQKEGVIAVEISNQFKVSPIIGVNYAISLGADLIILDEISNEEAEIIERRLQRWKDENNYNHFRKVCNKAQGRMSGYKIENYGYITFFTNGLPYGLGINNIIPSTHVDIGLRPDLFIVNGIGVETGGRFHSAVVFSPLFFVNSGGEETDEVVSVLENKKYYVRKLIGNDATSNNLDFHAQHFPYDFLHICTHGGEMDGCEVVLKFKDRNKVEHVVEYDEAVSFSLVPGKKDLVAVMQRSFFRKFDGYLWGSSKLKSQKISHYVFIDMWKAMKKEEIPRTRKKGKIPSAYAIQTVDGFNQGAFKILSSHHHPIIFNNSCWSWGQISTFFISAGARGYVGTLWPIQNDAAITAANKFYSMINEYSVMSCLYAAQKEISNTISANIYHYWGLHFTSMAENAADKEDSKTRVFMELVRSTLAWINKVNTTKNSTIRKNSAQVVRELHAELVNNFTDEDFKKLEKKFKDSEDVYNSKPDEDTLAVFSDNEIIRYRKK